MRAWLIVCAVLAAVAGAVLSARAQPSVPDPPICSSNLTEYSELAPGTDYRAMEQLLTRTPPACRQLRARISARIAAVRPPPPADPCVAAEARWTGGLRSSTDRAALQRFIADTPAQCAIVRDAAQQRLASLPATVVTRPPPQVNPCDAAETAWAALRASEDLQVLERFVSDTPALCAVRDEAVARLVDLRPPPAPTEAGATFRDCSGCPEMVVIPTGTLRLGDHRSVNFPHPMAVGRFEVTRAQYAAFVQATQRADGEGCQWTLPFELSPPRAAVNWRDPGFEQGDTHPVVCVSWEDAHDYAVWLSQRTHRTYHLLTNTQWAFAAQSGTNSFMMDNGIMGNVPDAALRARYSRWQNARSSNDGAVFTASVGSYRANAFGLSDMWGNVSEWVEDCATQRGTTTRPELPLDGSAFFITGCPSHDVRGGSWLFVLGTQDHLSIRAGERHNAVGFRVAAVLD